MKRLIYISLALIGLSGCKKFLTNQPESFLAPSAYYSGNNLTAALAGVYAPLSTSNLYGAELLNGIGMGNDESFFGGNGRTITGANTAAYNYDFTLSNVSNLWTTLYTGIERANQLIANINANDPSAATQAAYGEALFLRGFYHFLLVTKFGAVPLKITPTVSPANLDMERTPIEDVYKQIVSDMKLAESKVLSADKIGYGGRVSKTAVEGMLAKVYLFMAGYPLNGGTAGATAQYDSCLVYANKVVNSGLHSLNPSYSQVFINYATHKGETKESMWEVEFSGTTASTIRQTGQNGISNGMIFNSTATYDGAPGSTRYIYYDSGFAYAYVWATKQLYDLYAATDTRRDWAIQPFNYSITGGPNWLVTRSPIANATPFAYNRSCAKWRRTYETTYPKDQYGAAINFPLLRYSDVLLMLAEADLNANGGAISMNGLNAINLVRERGYGLTGSGVPIKSLTITNPGSGYTGTVVNGFNGASVANLNLGNGLAFESTIAGGQVTSVRLVAGGYGFTAASANTIYLGNFWTANTNYVVNQQIISNGNLYTVTTAGRSTTTPPTQSSGASSAAVTGAVFTWAGVPATATGTLVTNADVDLTAVTMQDIRDERSRELCFETWRFGDLIRWNIFLPTMAAMQGQVNGWSTFTGTNVKQTVLAPYTNVAPKHLLLPIPSSEMSVNKKMTQNPGW